MHDLSTFLFARPSALEGAARILDFGNTLNEYNTSLSPAQADELALRADWQAVGNSIRESMARFAREHRAALVAAGHSELAGNDQAEEDGNAASPSRSATPR
jgi:hypothetical protein